MTLLAAVDIEDVESVDERTATERTVLAPTLGWTSGLASEPVGAGSWILSSTVFVLATYSSPGLRVDQRVGQQNQSPNLHLLYGCFFL